MEEQRKIPLTLEDLNTAWEIYCGLYDFRTAHPNIQNKYSANMKGHIERGLPVSFFDIPRNPMDDISDIMEDVARSVSEESRNQPDKILISEENCRKIETILEKFFERPTDYWPHFFGLVQLDGRLTNFKYFGRYFCGSNQPIHVLRMLGMCNLFPLPAAQAYLASSLDVLNGSDVLLKTIANSSVESALLILKYINPVSIFYKDEHMGNDALILAIAKGRHHIESGHGSSLPLGHVIDAILEIVRLQQLDVSLCHNKEGDNLPAIGFAGMHGDVDTVSQLIALGVLAPHQSNEPDIAEGNTKSHPEIPSYADVTKYLCAYTTYGNVVDERIHSTDDSHHHYGTCSILEESRWHEAIDKVMDLRSYYRNNSEMKTPRQ